MKFISILLFCFLASVKSVQKNDLFLKIASYNYGYSVKEILLSKDLEETWMNSYMICLNSGMEMLRIDTADELLTVTSALKLNWLKFDDKVHVDGIKTKKDAWKYLSNEKTLDPNVYNLTTMINTHEDKPEKCMSIYKNDIVPEFYSGTDCYFGDVKKFACQKITQQYARSVENDHQLKVDVTSRILDEIGSSEVYESKFFKRSTYFINRDSVSTKLSMTKALNFCKSFGMNLVDLNDKHKYDSLIRLIVKNEGKVNSKFLIAGTRSSFIDSQSWVSFMRSEDNAVHKNCLSIIADQTSEKRRIFYVDCNERMNFVCERIEKRSKEENLYSKMNGESDQMIKRTSGMKIIGDLKICDKASQCKMSYYISESIVAATWFEAFSYCKAIGMDLYSPGSNKVNDQIFKFLSKVGVNSTVAVGGSRIGTEVFWFSTKTGKEVDFNAEPTQSNANCLQLVIKEFKAINCDSGSSRFMCESLE